MFFRIWQENMEQSIVYEKIIKFHNFFSYKNWFSLIIYHHKYIRTSVGSITKLTDAKMNFFFLILIN